MVFDAFVFSADSPPSGAARQPLSTTFSPSEVFTAGIYDAHVSGALVCIYVTFTYCEPLHCIGLCVSITVNCCFVTILEMPFVAGRQPSSMKCKECNPVEGTTPHDIITQCCDTVECVY